MQKIDMAELPGQAEQCPGCVAKHTQREVETGRTLRGGQRATSEIACGWSEAMQATALSVGALVLKAAGIPLEVVCCRSLLTVLILNRVTSVALMTAHRNYVRSFLGYRSSPLCGRPAFCLGRPNGIFSNPNQPRRSAVVGIYTAWRRVVDLWWPFPSLGTEWVASPRLPSRGFFTPRVKKGPECREPFGSGLSGVVGRISSLTLVCSAAGSKLNSSLPVASGDPTSRLFCPTAEPCSSCTTSPDRGFLAVRIERIGGIRTASWLLSRPPTLDPCPK